jgi:hypothetical protein
MTFGVEKPHRSSVGSGLLVAIAVGVLTFFSDVVVLSVTYSTTLLVIDSILLGAMAGAVAWMYEQRHKRLTANKLDVIAQMNHLVRNDLEIIQYSAYATQDQEHIQHIDECLRRIDWALREVLPSEAPPKLAGWKNALVQAQQRR